MNGPRDAAPDRGEPGQVEPDRVEPGNGAPRSVGAGRASRRHVGLWTLAVLLLALLLVRTFAFDVYRVASSSMEPTLLEGERVLVLYDRSPPRRYELVVLSRPGETEPLVKRVVGLPEESVKIVGGDCLIDGRRLPVEAGRTGPFVVLDEAVHDLGQVLNLGYGLWTRKDGVWEVDARALERADPAGLVFAVPDVTDDYLKNGASVRGTQEVNDLELAGEVWIEGPTGRVRFGVNEMGDDFWVELELSHSGDLSGGGPDADKGPRATLLRSQMTTKPDAERAFDELLATDVALEPGRWHRVRIANVDNVLRAWLDDELVLRASYDANRFAETDEFFEGRSPGARLWLGADGTRARFRNLVVSRDVYYTGLGRFAQDEPEQLGPDEIFVLGDNSGRSQDSREWGPVSLSEVLGRPVWVVWPPSSWRSPRAADRP